MTLRDLGAFLWDIEHAGEQGNAFVVDYEDYH